MATFSLCLLAQAYEQAYNLLQIFAELEMTVNILIQIDKLVQLLESPVFTYLRLQLLEPEKYPHLYKCLYGLLMLLPQSSAFAALKNRLNSVSSIGYLHIAPRPNATTPSVPSFDRPNRLKGREEGIIRWAELLEKFRTVQERARRLQRLGADTDDSPFGVGDLRIGGGDGTGDMKPATGREGGGTGPSRNAGGGGRDSPAGGTNNANSAPAKPEPPPKTRTGLGRQLGRFGVAGRGKRNP